jgi:phage baseplate assembly protein W
MTTGVGFDSTGLAPAGLGTPTQNLDLATLGYQKSTTGCVSSLNVARDGDYSYDDNGNEEGMSDTAQRVMLCLKTTAGSRVEYQDFGLRIPETTAGSVEAAVRLALAPVLDDNSVTLDSVESTTSGTGAQVIVWWTDQRTRKQRSTPLPMRA